MLPPEAVVVSMPRLLAKALSVSTILPQLGSMLMSVARGATKDQVDVCGLDSLLKSY